MAALAVGLQDSEIEHQRALDALQAFVEYFDGSAPLSQRTQRAMHALRESRELIRKDRRSVERKTQIS